jgi:hypothetical protein
VEREEDADDGGCWKTSEREKTEEKESKLLHHVPRVKSNVPDFK